MLFRELLMTNFSKIKVVNNVQNYRGKIHVSENKENHTFVVVFIIDARQFQGDRTVSSGPAVCARTSVDAIF